jgi:hypothetical protein
VSPLTRVSEHEPQYLSSSVARQRVTDLRAMEGAMWNAILGNKSVPRANPTCLIAEIKPLALLAERTTSLMRRG